MNDRPIGLFDSGVGGLTVMREISRLLPRENLIYLGDTGRLPYGNKSPEAIIRFSLEIGSFLANLDIKLLVIACHTASSYALDLLCKQLPIPVVGVVHCGISHLLQITQTNEVAVLGTKSTIASNLHKNLILNVSPETKVHTLACPLFVPLVEEGWLDHAATQLIAHHYLDPLLHYPIDTFLLACTHYPMLRETIQKVLGPSKFLVEPATACAKEVFSLLTQKSLLNQQKEKPRYLFYSTDAPDHFQSLASLFFGSEIPEVKLKVLSS